MLNYSTSCFELPDLTVYVNCDTVLAVNLQMFNLSDDDELIFAIKNYDYVESSYIFLQRIHKGEENKNGEVLFKITPKISKKIKSGAFYNFTVLVDALNPKAETEYKKLTNNGKIILEYGAQDLLVGSNQNEDCLGEIIDARVELVE